MLKNLKISERLGVGFGLMTVIIIVLLITGIREGRILKRILTDEILHNNLRKDYANTMASQVRDVSLTLWTMAATEDRTKNQELRQEILNYRVEYDSSLTNYEKLVDKSETFVLEHVARIKKARDAARDANNSILDDILSGKGNNGAERIKQFAIPKVDEWINEVYILLDYEKKKAAEISGDSAALIEETQTNYIIFGIFALLMAIVIPMVTAISLTRPVDFMTKLIASRDITADISQYREGRFELNLMIQSFHREMKETARQEEKLKNYQDQLEVTVEKRTAELSKVIMEVKETVNILVSASEQILAATMQVSDGTNQTATAINETTTTVEEVLQASRLSAMKAKNVADSAQSVARVSQEGREAVEATVKSIYQIKEQMDSVAQTVVRLSEQSQSIGGIIASVTDIADQSNLLAVNAAIEAAKAGEHGRGFAVVAQEIKNMASQSKQATLQVRNILNDIQKATGAAVIATEQGSKAVEAGVKLSVKSGESIKLLSDSSTEAVQAATQIVASSQQQVVGMDQISVAMQNINQAGTEVAVSMTQTEKSAKSLNELGMKLKSVVESIKV